VTVTRSLRQGVIETGRRPHIALSLYTLTLIAALLFAVPMALLLDRAVGRNAAARGLEATLRLDVVLDFLRTERPALLDHFQAVGCGALDGSGGPAILLTVNLASPVRGSKRLTDDDIAELKAGNWACVIDSDGESGEISGALEPAR